MFPTYVSAWLICQVSGDDCGQRQRASVKQTDAAFQENSVFFLTLTLDYSQRQGMIAKNMRDVTLIIFLCVLISIKRKFFLEVSGEEGGDRQQTRHGDTDKPCQGGNGQF